jgi:hypothetical protein
MEPGGSGARSGYKARKGQRTPWVNRNQNKYWQISKVGPIFRGVLALSAAGAERDCFTSQEIGG